MTPCPGQAEPEAEPESSIFGETLTSTEPVADSGVDKAGLTAATFVMVVIVAVVL